jgi:glutamate dehydrogenase
MYLKQDILNSDVPEDPFFTRYLTLAFPKPLREKYLPQMKEHSLRREIIATQLGKFITDHMGINFVERLQRESGANVSFIMRAFVITEAIYGMEQVWNQIEALDHKITTATQQKMMLQLYYLIRRGTRWFLRNRKAGLDIQQTIQDFKPAIAELIQRMPELLINGDKELLDAAAQSLVDENVPPALANTMAIQEALYTSLDIVEASRKSGYSITDMAYVYYSLGNLLELNWLRTQMNEYPMENQWDELARSSYRDDLDNVQRRLSIRVLDFKHSHKQPLTACVAAWMEENDTMMQRWHSLLAEIKSSSNIGFVTYSVILRELFDFAHTEQANK